MKLKVAFVLIVISLAVVMTLRTERIYIIELSDRDGTKLVYIDSGLVVGGQKGRLDTMESMLRKQCPDCNDVTRTKVDSLPYEYEGMLEKEPKAYPYVHVEDGDKVIVIYVESKRGGVALSHCQNTAKQYSSRGAKATCVAA